MDTNIMTDRNTFQITDTLSFFPNSAGKYEQTRKPDFTGYVFFATVDNSTKIDIKFDEQELFP